MFISPVLAWRAKQYHHYAPVRLGFLGFIPSWCVDRDRGKETNEHLTHVVYSTLSGKYKPAKSAEPISSVATDMAKTVTQLYPTLTVSFSDIVQVGRTFRFPADLLARRLTTIFSFPPLPFTGVRLGAVCLCHQLYKRRRCWICSNSRCCFHVGHGLCRHCSGWCFHPLS